MCGPRTASLLCHLHALFVLAVSVAFRRPSGIPEDDVRSAVVPYLLKQRRLLQQSLREKEEANARLAETVLAGRRRIADLQEEIQRRKADWQVGAA